MRDWSRSDFIELLATKYYTMDLENYNWCLTLPEEFADARDFEASETLDIDWSIKLPKSFSLGEWIFRTNYQGSLWACTSCATSHWVQVLNVKAKGVKPVSENLITPSWRDLRKKMGHSTTTYDGWDYVEKAVNTAYKMWITNEEWGVSTFDGYAYWQWEESNKWIETIKRYIYNWNPVVWCMRWNSTTWTELTLGQLKTVIKSEDRTGGHAIACVGWDEWWLWFVNSWKTNDWKWYKSRFYATYDFMKRASGMFNWRYWLPFKNAQAIKDAEYLKRKNIYKAVIEALKKTYPNEDSNMQKAIEDFSKVCRASYEELNEEIPLKS